MFKVFWISWSAHHHVIGRGNGIWTFLETFSLQNGSQAILASKRVLNKHEINQINFTQEEEEQICSQKVQLSKRIGHIGEVKEAWLLKNDWWTPHRNHFSVNVGGHQFYVRVPSKHCWWCWCSWSDGSKCDGLKMRLQRWRSEGCWWRGGGNEFKNKQKIMPQLVACIYTHTILGTLSSWAWVSDVSGECRGVSELLWDGAVLEYSDAV